GGGRLIPHWACSGPSRSSIPELLGRATARPSLQCSASARSAIDRVFPGALPTPAATCPGQQRPRSDLRSLVGGRPRKGGLPLAPRLSLSCVPPEIVPSQAISSDRVSRPHTSSVWSAKQPLWFARRTETRRSVL